MPSSRGTGSPANCSRASATSPGSRPSGFAIGDSLPPRHRSRPPPCKMSLDSTDNHRPTPFRPTQASLEHLGEDLHVGFLDHAVMLAGDDVDINGGRQGPP